MSAPTRTQVLETLATADPFSGLFGMDWEEAEILHGDQADAIMDLLNKEQP